jgi:hypothetical protein
LVPVPGVYVKISFPASSHVEDVVDVGLNVFLIDKLCQTVNRSGFTQSLNFKYLYMSHCNSNELLWALHSMVSFKSPKQFAGFTVTLPNISSLSSVQFHLSLCKATPIDGTISSSIKIEIQKSIIIAK